jgi:general secretion pathway protein K
MTQCPQDIPRRASSSQSSSEQGFVIVAVLWILAALAGLAGIFAAYMSNSAQALAVGDRGLRTEALVSASLELTAYQLLLAGDKKRPPSGSFRFRMNGAGVQVAFTSEAARIDLNVASKETLASLFVVLGARKEDAKEYADRIIGWRTRPIANSANEEAALYAAAGLPYPPRQSLFTHVNELHLVLGLPLAMVERALSFVTVFSGVSDVDKTIAAPEVVAAVSGATPSDQDFAPRQRSGSPNGPSTNPDAAKDAPLQLSDAYRVLTTIRFDDGRLAASEAVITRGNDDDPYRVLAWQDDVPIHARASRRNSDGNN